MQHPRTRIFGEPSARELDEADLAVLIAQAVELLERIEREGGSTSEEPSRYAANQRRKLAVLRVLLSMDEPQILPRLDHRAPNGHACPWIEESFELEPGGGLTILEELADLGLLQRQLRNVVNLCPKCGGCHVNFRESCVACGSLDIYVEGLIHHFRCAHVGLEREFRHELDLVCPKCSKELHQLGQDFERPHDTYVCTPCHYLFEEPLLEGQCLQCEAVFPGGQVESERIHGYRPTPLTVRAIELNRLTGLDVNSVMFDQTVHLASRDYLDLQVRRELARIKRYGGEFTCVLLGFQQGRQRFAMFREWPAQVLRRLGSLLDDSLRTLDLVCRLDEERIGLFMPETDVQGAAVVRGRILGVLDELALTTRAGNPVIPQWDERTWGGDASAEEIMGFMDGAR